jgi:hypothetical protein
MDTKEENKIKEIIENYIDQEQFKIDRNKVLDDFKTKPKYIAIRRIPIIFLIFLIILGSLLYVNYTYNIDNNKKILIDKIINLITGIIIAISGVYLWMVRTEYHYLIKQLIKEKNIIEKLNKNEKINEIFNIYLSDMATNN